MMTDPYLAQDGHVPDDSVRVYVDAVYAIVPVL